MRRDARAVVEFGSGDLTPNPSPHRERGVQLVAFGWFPVALCYSVWASLPLPGEGGRRPDEVAPGHVYEQ